jgi:hypothetical protein
MNLISLIPTPYKIAAAAILATALIGGAYLKGYDRGKTDYQVLKAEITQQAKDQQKADDAQIAKDTTVSKEVYAEAQQKLADAGNTINDLTSRVQHSGSSSGQVSTTSCTASQPNTVTNGPAVAGRNSSPTEATGPATEEESTISTDTLRDALQTGIDALNAELLWRQWQRGVE